MTRLKFKCQECGRLTAGKKPRGGDGSARRPRKHKTGGKVCRGSFGFADWVEVEIKNGTIVEIKNWGD